jgi:hypothetical protein
MLVYVFDFAILVWWRTAAKHAGLNVSNLYLVSNSNQDSSLELLNLG